MKNIVFKWRYFLTAWFSKFTIHCIPVSISFQRLTIYERRYFYLAGMHILLIFYELINKWTKHIVSLFLFIFCFCFFFSRTHSFELFSVFMCCVSMRLLYHMVKIFHVLFVYAYITYAMTCYGCDAIRFADFLRIERFLTRIWWDCRYKWTLTLKLFI